MRVTFLGLRSVVKESRGAKGAEGTGHHFLFVAMVECWPFWAPHTKLIARHKKFTLQRGGDGHQGFKLLLATCVIGMSY
jgi:hypothetical protein